MSDSKYSGNEGEGYCRESENHYSKRYPYNKICVSSVKLRDNNGNSSEYGRRTYL